MILVFGLGFAAGSLVTTGVCCWVIGQGIRQGTIRIRQSKE